jgi:threonine aldolase
VIERAWEGKFLFGGAMRQAGVIAAAALYALDHHVDRLAEDHARARRIDPEAETNFAVLEDAPGLQERLRERGLLVGNLRPGWLRAVTYLGISDDDADQAAAILDEVHVHA